MLHTLLLILVVQSKLISTCITQNNEQKVNDLKGFVLVTFKYTMYFGSDYTWNTSTNNHLSSFCLKRKNIQNFSSMYKWQNWMQQFCCHRSQNTYISIIKNKPYFCKPLRRNTQFLISFKLFWAPYMQIECFFWVLYRNMACSW